MDQLGEIDTIRIAGFHLWDCVDKLAKRAYERGLKTLVDEDLTELFGWRITERDFKIAKYPTFNPRKHWKEFFNEFMQPRKTRPWLYNKY